MATKAVRPKLNPLFVAGGLLSTLAPHPAQATGAKYRLQVVRADGAASCASGSAIEQDVTRRLGRSPFADDGERGIEIVLERAETGWRAKLYLRLDPSEPDAARVLESSAPDCSELAKSVALAVSLAIAPDLPVLEPKPAPELACPPAPPPPPPPPPPRTLHGTVSLRGLWSPHLLPSGSLGAALAVTLRGELFGASLGGLFYPEAQLQRDAAQLGFGISAGFASGCLWARTREPELWSCLGARVGALHSVVYSPQPVGPGDRAWVAVDTELGLRQTLFGRVFIEAGAAAVFPLVRHRFLVDGDSTPIYEQGAALVEGFVGLGARLD